jgi:hypothetical protein
MSQSFNQPNDYAQTVMTFAQSMVAEYSEKAANAAEGSADKRAYMDYADHFAKQVEEYEERERIFAHAAELGQRVMAYNATDIQRVWRGFLGRRAAALQGDAAWQKKMMRFAQTMVAEYTEKAANAAEGSVDKSSYTQYAEHFAEQVAEYEERERVFGRIAAAEAALWDDSCCQLGCDCNM